MWTALSCSNCRTRWSRLAVSAKSAARHAAEVVIEHAQPKMLVSAGLAGALSPQLKIGDVGRIREVVDVATGERYAAREGEWVLATSQEISDVAEKKALMTKYRADVVDMEGGGGGAGGQRARPGVCCGQGHLR